MREFILIPVRLSLFYYDKNTDYQALIDRAAANGDYAAAARYEQQRNEKIATEGLGYGQTNKYAKYLNDDEWTGGSGGYNSSKNYDYSSELRNLMDSGSSDADYMQRLLDERTLKAQSNSGLSHYADDDFSYQVRDYISGLRRRQNETDSYAEALSRYDNTDPIDLDSIMAQIGDAIGPAPTYSSDWDKTKELLAQAALDMNYGDWTESDQYKGLEDRYSRAGSLAMQDVLGQLSGRTGGLASSYAATVAGQQYNDYMAQLENIARQMYDSERSSAIQNAQLAYDYADNDYQRYLNDLSKYSGDRSYAYQVLSDAIAQSNYEREWRNTLAQQEYQRQQQEKQDAQQRIDSFIAAGGSAASLSPSLVSSSGYSSAELAALEKYYATQNAPKSTGGSGGGGGSGSKKTAHSDDYANVRKKAMSYDNAGDAEAYLNRMVDIGSITEDEAYNIFMVDLGGDTGSSDMLVPTTYEEFVAKTGYSGIMTKNEFLRRKSAGSAGAYKDYQDYLAKMWNSYKPN